MMLRFGWDFAVTLITRFVSEGRIKIKTKNKKTHPVGLQNENDDTSDRLCPGARAEIRIKGFKKITRLDLGLQCAAVTGGRSLDEPSPGVSKNLKFVYSVDLDHNQFCLHCIT